MGTVDSEEDRYIEIPVLFRCTKKELDTFRFGGYNDRTLVLLNILGDTVDGDIKNALKLGTPLYKASYTLEEDARKAKQHYQGHARKGGDSGKDNH